MKGGGGGLVFFFGFDVSCKQTDYEDFLDYDRKMMKLDMERKYVVYIEKIKKAKTYPSDTPPIGWVGLSKRAPQATTMS